MIPFLLVLTSLTTFPLSDLDIDAAEQGWGTPQRDRSVTERPLKIAGRDFARGWGTHAPGELIVDLGGRTSRFRAFVGVDANSGAGGTVRFIVIGDGKELYSSAVMTRENPAAEIDLEVKGVKTLILRTDAAGDGMGNDHANWCDATFITDGFEPQALEALPEGAGMINPRKRWRDTQGKIIQAHSGGVLQYGGRTYWFGEERTHGYHNKTGVAAYSSTDLVSWKAEGIVMPSAAFPEMYQDQGVCERPKVIRNAKTGKFVMWSHLDANGYRESRAGVAVADNVTGPYRHVKHYRPIGEETFRDMNLFVDDDGTAYVFYSSENNATMYIVKLADDYLSHAEPLVEGKTWAKAFEGMYREAPAPFKHEGRYYVITSGCTGWAPNQAQLAVADHPLGPWQVLGNPLRGPSAELTFFGQSTFVFKPDGAPEGWFVFMADRWNSENLADSRYIWLPFQMDGRGTVEIRWRDSWSPQSVWGSQR